MRKRVEVTGTFFTTITLSNVIQSVLAQNEHEFSFCWAGVLVGPISYVVYIAHSQKDNKTQCVIK